MEDALNDAAEIDRRGSADDQNRAVQDHAVQDRAGSVQRAEPLMRAVDESWRRIPRGAPTGWGDPACKSPLFEPPLFKPPLCDPLGVPPEADLHDALRRRLSAETRLTEAANIDGRLERFFEGASLTRAKLAASVCLDLGGPWIRALAVGAAVEMAHAASLILDDLPAMDDADTRRGAPALHREVGEAAAILAALGLINRATTCLVECDAPERMRLHLVSRFHQGIGPDAAIRGQLRDLGCAPTGGDLASLLEIHRLKTAAVFETAAALGVIAGEGDEADHAMRSVIAAAGAMGALHQIADDAMDRAQDDAAESAPEAEGGRAGCDAPKAGPRPNLFAVATTEEAAAATGALVDRLRVALADMPKGRAAALLRERSDKTLKQLSFLLTEHERRLS